MKKAGLALGGGAVLGAAHIGVLRAIDEVGIGVSHLTGTSIGAFVAVFYAFGKNWEEIGEIAKKLDWFEISEISLSRYGLLSNKKVGDLIREHIGDKNMEDADIPLAVIATNISNGEKVVLDEGPVADAVTASTCIPGIFKPVRIDDKMLVDGGIVENVPVQTNRAIGADFVIGVDLNAKYVYGKPENILDILINSYHFLTLQSDKLQTASADLLIKPDLSDFSRSDSDQVEALMKKGYEDARATLEKLDLK